MEIPSAFQLATSAQSKQIDAGTIENLNIPGRILMEVAGAKAAAIIEHQINPGSKILVFCGKGNNAGDGLVTARYLSQNNYPVTVVFAAGSRDLSVDARTNLDLLIKLNDSNITVFDDLPDLNNFPVFDIIIDALLGVGITNDVRSPYNRIIDFINLSGKPVYALDVPTGLHADNGSILGNCVKADVTLSFGTMKLGCYLENGPGVSGNRIHCDIGFPGYLKSEIQRYAIDPQWVDNMEIQKKSPLHKYEAGIVYIIAGSPGLCGAAVMAAESAWSEGLGAVSVICPLGLMEIFETQLVHQTKFVVGSKADTVFKPVHLDEILRHINRREGTVILGPGLGRDAETANFVKELVRNYQGKIVIDADAIWAISEELSLLHNENVIMTPHPGELKYLIKKDTTISFDRVTAVEDFCKKHNIYLLSKGLPIVLGTPGGLSFITQYDSTVFSRTGFGDILAGKIAAFWELTGNPVYSCSKALLNGKIRYEEHEKHYSTVPQPLDLI